MLQRIINQSSKRLTIASFYSSGSAPGFNENPNEEIKLTDYNPQRIRALRGYEGLAEQTQEQRTYSPIHSHVRKTFTCYNLFSYLPNSAVKKISQLTQETKLAPSGDGFYLPKTTPNAIPLYHSLYSANMIRKFHRLLPYMAATQMLALSIVGFKLTGLLGAGLFGYLYRETYWKLTQRLVLKLELITQTEEIAYQKVGFFGAIVTKRASISDLQYYDIEKELGQSNFFERQARSYINKAVAFRLKSTGEELFFDRSGIWHQEGFKHQLLV